MELKIIFNAEDFGQELKETSEVFSSDSMIIGGLEGGMTSGKPSVAFLIDLADGKKVLAQTSLALLVSATRALVAKYGDPTEITSTTTH